MKILQICNKSPYPPIEGGPIAMNNITSGLLKAGHEVRVIAMNTPKHNVQLSDIPDTYKRNTSYKAVYVDTRIKPIKAFFNLFSKKSYIVERFISDNFESELVNILKSNKFDIVHLESIFVAPYTEVIRKHSDAKIILRAHNIEHLIWERLAESCNNPVKKLYLNHLSKTLRSYETTAAANVDGIAAITEKDAAYFKEICSAQHVTSIPSGIDSSIIIEYKGEKEFPGFFHLGSMDWMPNQEGIRWLLNNVWEKVVEKFSKQKLYLAGRNMPSWLSELNMQGVMVEGEVNKAHEYMQSKSVMLVPLLSGSGMRIKIVEGMACGNTIITTTIGAEGIECTNGKDIFIADTPDEFLACIKECISNPGICSRIGENARKLIKEKYDNDAITAKLVKFYEEVKKKKS